MQQRQNTHKAIQTKYTLKATQTEHTQSIQMDKIHTKQNTQTKYKATQKRQNTYTNKRYKVLCLVPEVTGI